MQMLKLMACSVAVFICRCRTAASQRGARLVSDDTPAAVHFRREDGSREDLIHLG